MRPLLARFLGLSFARAFGALANTGALILVARSVGANDFGALAVILSVLAAVAGVLGLGMPAFALRAAVLGRQQAVGYAIALNLYTSAAIVAIGIAYGSLTAEPLLVVGCLALTFALEKNSDIRVGLGTEFGRAKLVNAVLVFRGVVPLAFVGGALITDRASVDAYVSGRLIGAAVAALVLALSIREWRVIWRRPRDGSLESLSGLAFSNAAGAVRQIDVWIVGLLSGSAAAGDFAAAQRLVAPLSLFANNMSVVAMGASARESMTRARRAVRFTGWSAVAALAPAVALAALSPQIVSLVLGDSFTEATAALAWFIIAVPPLATLPVIATILQGRGLANAVAVNSVVMTGLFVVCVVVGAATDGATGAALGFTVATWVRLITMLAISRKLTET
ncbi:lipopolysaccharide biosynthesis protein [Cellulomonas sp. S1-8]|uniref:lipopolysaccharide biosynthesis protein n=1 Tax=Cellulomonas sp. S1-8 TaxID=2904790 RepID=UPI002244D741|nr:hypothetical protein [Cellulomonas sp. S1-8]UZN04137.1 hypothetical protein OKX07_04150 [Cellulomonas sp. S1-8]